MEQQLSLGFLIPRWGRDESWGVWILWEDIECILLAFGCPDCCAGKDGEKNTSSPAGASVRAWKEMEKLSPNSRRLCCYHVRRPYVASGLGLSLSSRLETQRPTVIPTPESPQMPPVQDHTHKPPLKTWSSSLGTHVSVTKRIIQSHKMET